MRPQGRLREVPGFQPPLGFWGRLRPPRRNALNVDIAGEVALANSAYRMKTFYEWVKQKEEKKGEAPARNWNEVSLQKLLTGRM